MTTWGNNIRFKIKCPDCGHSCYGFRHFLPCSKGVRKTLSRNKEGLRFYYRNVYKITKQRNTYGRATWASLKLARRMVISGLIGTEQVARNTKRVNDTIVFFYPVNK